MKFFTFSAMLLLQRIDTALRLERQRPVANPDTVAALARKKRRVAARLGRLLPPSALAGS